MLNVRDISRQSVMKNEEIKNLVQIIGLKYGIFYIVIFMHDFSNFS